MCLQYCHFGTSTKENRISTLTIRPDPTDCLESYLVLWAKPTRVKRSQSDDLKALNWMLTSSYEIHRKIHTRSYLFSCIVTLFWIWLLKRTFYLHKQCITFYRKLQLAKDKMTGTSQWLITRIFHAILSWPWLRAACTRSVTSATNMVQLNRYILAIIGTLLGVYTPLKKSMLPNLQFILGIRKEVECIMVGNQWMACK